MTSENNVGSSLIHAADQKPPTTIQSLFSKDYNSVVSSLSANPYFSAGAGLAGQSY
jgi:chaperonin GroEL (HSP60 family)